MTSYPQGTQASLTSQWYQYAGGPAQDVNSLTITITRVADSTIVIGPTSAGVSHPSTGLYEYTWFIPADEPTGDYSVVWDATDQSANPVQASETITVTGAVGANVYATLAELKTELRITDTNDDTELESRLAAASRRVDRDTGRRFYVDSVTSSRIYRPTHAELLVVDDISTDTGLIIEVGRSTTWTTIASTAYDLLPENAVADGKAIETLVRVDGCWPLWGTTRVRVTAKWGWPAVPEEIKNATLLLAGRLFRRKDSLEGVKGFSDLGVVRVTKYDPDYDALIGPYVRDVH